MTLVQNLLLPLSGNKLSCVFFIFLSITSCSAKKITSTPPIEVVQIETSKQTTNHTSNLDSTHQNPIFFDIDNTIDLKDKPTPEIKPLNNDPNRVHNIVVLLPFFLDQIPLGNYVDDSTKQLNTDSKNAMDFYLGCKLAKEKFISSDLNTNIYFLDDKNDSSTIVKIFNQKPFPNIDLVIGTLGFKNLKLVADLAKTKQISVLSPFASSMYIRENPYFYNANASLKTQYNFILEKCSSSFPNKTIEIIYDGKDSTSENIQILKTIAEKKYANSIIKYISLKATDDIAKTLTQTDTTIERVVIVYSSKDSYIKSIVSKLKTIKNHLNIYTSIVLKNSKPVLDIKNTQTVYSISSYNPTPNYTTFGATFELKFKKKPTEICYQGYDILLHILNMLDNSQTLLDNNYTNTIDFNNTQTKFQFKPVLNKNDTVDYNDNSILFLYKYVNGIFTAVSSK